MRALRTTTCFGLGFLLLASPVSADELRLRDGRVLVGKVREQAGQLIVETLDGPVEIAPDQVVSRRTEAELRSELARLARDRGDKSAFDHLALAQQAFRFGLWREMWRELDRVLEHEALPPALDPAIGRFLVELEPVLLSPAERQATAVERARALVYQVKPGVGTGQRAAVLANLQRLDEIDDELRAQAHAGIRPDHRQIARLALVDREADANRAFLYRATVVGKTRDDREAAAALLVERGVGAEASEFLVPALLHDNPEVRIQAAEALARLGAPEVAVPALVEAGPLAGTPRALAGGGRPGNRSHMAQTTSRSYIRDFDVEIAQASAVGNPVVDVARSGVVLDVHVAAVVTHHARIALSYRRALHALAGSDPGANPREWREWMGSRYDRDTRVDVPPADSGAAPASPSTGRR